jgi:hypothetical protein
MKAERMNRRPWLIVVAAFLIFVANYVTVPVSANLMGDPGTDAGLAIIIAIIVILIVLKQANEVGMDGAPEYGKLAQMLPILVNKLPNPPPDQPPPSTPPQPKQKPCDACRGSKWGPGKVNCDKCLENGEPLGFTLGGRASDSGTPCEKCHGNKYVPCGPCKGTGSVAM